MHPSGFPSRMTSPAVLRPARAGDRPFLTEMLLEAAEWNPNRVTRSRADLLADPILRRYLEGWPRPGDLGIVAEADSSPVGAAWLRRFTADHPGYGFVAEQVPELSMAVVPAWRGRGLGRSLLRRTVAEARAAGIEEISLSVERANFAHRLYAGEGFEVVGRGADSDTMVLRVSP